MPLLILPDSHTGKSAGMVFKRLFTRSDVLPKSGTYFLAAVGVAWSPKLVNVNRARPRGAVRKLPNSGAAPS
jgi:hypothetical protein